MQSNRILLILQVMCLFTMFAGIISSAYAETDNGDGDKLLANSYGKDSGSSLDQKNLTSGSVTISEEEQQQADSLADTCPKGLHCVGCGACGKWTDIDLDNACDHGEVLA